MAPRDSKYNASPEFGRPPKIQVHDLNRSSPDNSSGPERGPQSARVFNRVMSSPGLRAMEDAHSAFLKAKGNLQADISPRTGSWSSSPTAYSSSNSNMPAFRSIPEMPQSPSRYHEDGELERLREQLKAANEKLFVTSRGAQESKAAAKELQELRREARDALSEMADQNKQLVEAYMTKKAELRNMEETLQSERSGARGSSEREAELEKRLQGALKEIKALKAGRGSPDANGSDTTGLLRMAREETDELRMANHRQAREIEMLQQKVEELQGELEISEACKSGNSSGRVRRGSFKVARCNTPKTLKIEALDAMNAELREQNEKILREHAEIADRARRREEAEAARHEATCSFQKSDYMAASEQYSKAISCQVDDAKYNAILYLNRAACYQAVRDFLRCISDCCTAASLDPTMPKIYHRRADAYQAIQHYSGAYNDMVILKERLGKGGGEVDTRLESLQQLANKNVQVDHGLVLGVSNCATDKEVKTAYRRLSLVHHPDKVTAMERPGAETIFKILSEAHRALTSAVKPMQPLRARRNTYC